MQLPFAVAGFLHRGGFAKQALITQGKRQHQTILVYEPWARVVRWIFERFRELDSFSALCREIESIPFLFPDPPADDFVRYTFKIRMTKVQGGYKPTHVESIRYILTNPAYIGAWVYRDAIVRENNHPAIVDRELFMWAYTKLTGRDLQGEYLGESRPRRLRDTGAQAVLIHLLHDPYGPLYVSKPEHPEYVRQTLKTDPKRAGRLFRDNTFAIRAHLIDNVYLERVKEIAHGDIHFAQHIQASITELQQKHTKALISVDEHLAQVRREQEKTLALLHDHILDTTPTEKAKYEAMLEGLQEREKELLAAKEQTLHVKLQAEFLELADVLADVPAKLDDSSMEHKQRLARLITESVTIEELSVHWLRLTVVWRSPLAVQPDVCLIWRQRGRRSDPWTAKEDEFIKANYPTADKWTMLEALPRRSWNMIYQRALGLGIHRATYTMEDIPLNICVEDLRVIPDPDLAMELVLEASKRQERSGRLDPERGNSQMQAYPVWLYPAHTNVLAAEREHRNMTLGS